VTALFPSPSWRMVRRLIHSIAVTAMESGHPDLVFVIVALVGSALMTLTLRFLIELV
jgi:hypothetical protein